MIARIDDAFADVSYPGDDDLIARPTYGDEPEAVERNFLGRTNWRSLDGAFLNQAVDGCGGALSFFSNRAFRFYLPAYLVADIRGQLDYDDPASRLCTFLTPQSGGVRLANVWGGGTMGEHSKTAFGLLTREQRACVVDYLWWKLGTGDVDTLIIEQALEHYWLRDP